MRRYLRAWGALVRFAWTLVCDPAVVDRFLAGSLYGDADVQSVLDHTAQVAVQTYEKRRSILHPVELVFLDVNEQTVIGTRFEAPHRRQPTEECDGRRFAAVRTEGHRVFYRELTN